MDRHKTLIWRLVGIAAATAAVIAAVWSGIWIRRVESPAIVSSVEGSLERVYGDASRAIRAGERLAPGEVVQSGRASKAVLALRDGAQIELRSNTEMSLTTPNGSPRVHLMTGGFLVIQGEVRVQQKGIAKTLLAGEETSTGPLF